MNRQEAEHPDARKRRVGVRFDMRGGPADGMLLRLWPHPYGDPKVLIPARDRSGDPGWDELPMEGGRYVRPSDVNPLMDAKKANKKRDNVPHMVWCAESGEARNDERVAA